MFYFPSAPVMWHFPFLVKTVSTSPCWRPSVCLYLQTAEETAEILNSWCTSTHVRKYFWTHLNPVPRSWTTDGTTADGYNEVSLVPSHAQRSALAAVLRTDCRGQGGRWETNYWTLTVTRGEMVVAWARGVAINVMRDGQILDTQSIFLRKKKRKDSLTNWNLPKWA